MLKSVVIAIGLLLLQGQQSRGDDLPSDLLLKCELKQTVFSTYRGKSDTNEMQLTKAFRLKDGTFSWAESTLPAGKNCKLISGTMACEYSATIPLSNTPGFPNEKRTEKRHSKVQLNRSTGEMKLVLETWGYPRDTATGTPDHNMKLIQFGVCQSIGKAVF